MKFDVSVAICTKDRLDDLWSCMRALCARPQIDLAIEILVIDDGQTPPVEVAKMTALAGEAGCTFVYHRKSRDFGLFNSRIVARDLARGEILLYLDDDATVEPDYLSRLVERYRTDATLAGVGGVDTLSEPVRLSKFLFDRAFLLAAAAPGRLTASGYNGSRVPWKSLNDPFETEFLSGCNMSFRRDALAGLHPYSWLSGYSLGEDVIVSFHAAQKGRLVVDPRLRVKHHVSPANRFKREQLAYHSVVNGYEVGRVVRPGSWGRLASAWSIVGLTLKAVRPGHHREAIMAIRGIIQLLSPARDEHPK